MTVISTKRVMVHLTVKTYRAKKKHKTIKNLKIKRIHRNSKGLRKLLKSQKRRSKKNLLSP